VTKQHVGLPWVSQHPQGSRRSSRGAIVRKITQVPFHVTPPDSISTMIPFEKFDQKAADPGERAMSRKGIDQGIDTGRPDRRPHAIPAAYPRPRANDHRADQDLLATTVLMAVVPPAASYYSSRDRRDQIPSGIFEPSQAFSMPTYDRYNELLPAIPLARAAITRRCPVAKQDVDSSN
jgi:hypothetical protein